MIVFSFQRGEKRELRGEVSWPRPHSEGQGCKPMSARFKARGLTRSTALPQEGVGSGTGNDKVTHSSEAAKAGALRRLSPVPGSILKSWLPGPRSPARAGGRCLSHGRHQAERHQEIRQIPLMGGRNAFKWGFSLAKATGEKHGQLSDETLDRKGTERAARMGLACLSQWNLNAGKRFYSSLLHQQGINSYYTHFSDDDAVAEVKALD